MAAKLAAFVKNGENMNNMNVHTFVIQCVKRAGEGKHTTNGDQVR